MAMANASRLAAAVGAACLVGCSGPRDDSTSYGASQLAPGIVARVDDQDITLALLTDVAKRQHLSKQAAERAVVAQALLAADARTRFDGTGLIRVSERSAYSRALLDRVREEVRAAGPPKDSELIELRDERWMDFNRPVAVRTAHAVVIPKSDEDDAAAKAAAERIAAATRGVSDPEKFWKLANAVDTSPLEKRVEGLPFMTADGRAVYLDSADPRRAKKQTFDPAFSEAANAIGEVGQQSGVIKSKFGYHVILLMERVAGQKYDLRELRQLLARDVYERRAQQRLRELIDRLKARTRPELSRNVDELTALVAERK